MLERGSQDHIRSARRRLDNASDMYRQASDRQIDCRGSGQLIRNLNELLPDGLRLPPYTYAWLLTVG